MDNPDSLVLSFFVVSIDNKYALSKEIKSVLNKQEAKNIVKEINLFDLKSVDKFWDSKINKLEGVEKLTLRDGKFDTNNPLFAEFNYTGLQSILLKYKDEILNPKWVFEIFSKKYLGKTYVLVNLQISEEEILRIAFNSRGTKTFEVLDTIKEGKLVKRISGNFIYTYEKDKILFVERKIQFKPIKYMDKKATLPLPVFKYLF